MFRCAILDDYQNVAMTVADWGAITDRVNLVPFDRHIPGDDELASKLEPFEIIVAMRERTAFPRPLLTRLPNLRLLVTTGPFNTAIDLAAARENNIIVCGTRGDRQSTVELTWALILGLVRHIPYEADRLRSGHWQSTIGITLRGKQLSVLGLGEIGSNVALIGKALGMRTLAWSPNLTAERCEQFGAELASTKGELFQRADVLTIHLMLSERSHGIVGESELRQMKPSSYLINTSRAHLIQKDPLVRALEHRWVAGAAFDVFYQEPLCAGSKFTQLDTSRNPILRRRESADGCRGGASAPGGLRLWLV
jgi:phosphoglycerate dehydrogenase-like enzyme